MGTAVFGARGRVNEEAMRPGGHDFAAHCPVGVELKVERAFGPRQLGDVAHDEGRVRSESRVPRELRRREKFRIFLFFGLDGRVCAPTERRREEKKNPLPMKSLGFQNDDSAWLASSSSGRWISVDWFHDDGSCSGTATLHTGP